MPNHDDHHHHPEMNSRFASRHELEAMCYYVHDILKFLPELEDTLLAIETKLHDIEAQLVELNSSQG